MPAPSSATVVGAGSRSPKSMAPRAGSGSTVKQRRSGHDEDDHDEPEEKESGHHDEHGEEGEDEEHDHTSVIEGLFKDYDASASPTHKDHTATVITVNVQVLSMDDISDSKMEYVIDTRMTFTWFDDRLTSPSCREKKDCNDNYNLKLIADKLWMPDLYILNARVAKNHDQPLKNGMTYLRSNGQVLLSKRLTMTLRCPMYLSLYPMDTQKCPIVICPYSLTEADLILEWNEVGVGILDDVERGHNKFQLIFPVKTGRLKWEYKGPDVSGNFSCVNATFKLSRHNGYHIGYSYAVTSFIVIVSWISFWLPVTAVPARVTLGVTTLLTLLTTANFVRSNLPPIAYVTAIDVWVGVCTVFVFLSLLLFPVSHFLTSSNNVTENPVTLAVENRIYPFERKCKFCGGKKHRKIEKTVTPEPKINVDSTCRKLFPILYIIFNIAYWSYYIPRSNSDQRD